jgi:hypothetical protein
LCMSDRIEKTIELKAPVSRIWRALTDHHADRAETRLCSFTGVINRHRGSDCALGAGDQV